jgi:hypothetical protein
VANDRKHSGRRAATHRVPEYIDPEVTPPPQEPPKPSDLDGFDSIPPPIQDQLRMLAAGLGQVTDALGKVWDARKDGERLEKIDNKQDIANREISELVATVREFIMPAIKASQGRIDLLLQHHEANKLRVELFYDREWPAAVKALEGMTERLGRVERGQERQEHEMRGMSDRLNANQNALAARITAVEQFESRLAMIERDKRDVDVTSSALARRTRTVTTVLSTLAGLVAGLAGSFIK